MINLTHFTPFVAIALLSTSILTGCGRSTSWARRGEKSEVRGIAKFSSEESPGVTSDHYDATDFQLTSVSMPVTSPGLVTLGASDDFESQIRNAKGVVLVDFYADWCGPCGRQGAILHELEEDASQMGAVILKVNVDEHKAIARKFSVSSLPTLIVFKNGAIVDRQTGLTDRKSVERLLKM